MRLERKAGRWVAVTDTGYSHADVSLIDACCGLIAVLESALADALVVDAVILDDDGDDPVEVRLAEYLSDRHVRDLNLVADATVPPLVSDIPSAAWLGGALLAEYVPDNAGSPDRIRLTAKGRRVHGLRRRRDGVTTAAELAETIYLLDRWGVQPVLVGGDESDTYPVPVVRWSAVYELIAPHLTDSKPRGL